MHMELSISFACLHAASSNNHTNSYIIALIVWGHKVKGPDGILALLPAGPKPNHT